MWTGKVGELFLGCARREMGTTDLIQLIDLSLGVEPNGIVNLNYLHTLLHAIVNRLGAVEDAQLGAELHLGDGVGAGGGTAQARVGLGGEGVGAEEGADGTDGEKGGAGRDDVEGGSDKRDTLGGASDTEKLDTKTEAGSDGRQQQQQQQKGVPTSFSPISPTPLSSSQGGQDSKPPSRRDMRTSVTQLQKPKSGVASAANDLGAMERKLKELESRLNAMDTLPELLERKAADVDATPMRDRWNYTNLSKRLSAAEDNMDQVSIVSVLMLSQMYTYYNYVTFQPIDVLQYMHWYYCHSSILYLCYMYVCIEPPLRRKVWKILLFSFRV